MSKPTHDKGISKSGQKTRIDPLSGFDLTEHQAAALKRQKQADATTQDLLKRLGDTKKRK